MTTIDIICVENNELFQQMIAMSFELIDSCLVNLKMFETSDEADSYYKSLVENNNKPDLILLDINLPTSSFNGIELLKRINQEYGNSVIIGMETRTTESEEIEKCKKLGANFVLHKTSNYEFTIPAIVQDLKKFKDKKIPFKIYK